jgi:hypothetical protein
LLESESASAKPDTKGEDSRNTERVEENVKKDKIKQGPA